MIGRGPIHVIYMLMMCRIGSPQHSRFIYSQSSRRRGFDFREGIFGSLNEGARWLQRAPFREFYQLISVYLKGYVLDGVDASMVSEVKRGYAE
jgi:hypothetical protein